LGDAVGRVRFLSRVGALEMIYYWAIGTPIVALSIEEGDEITELWWSYIVLPQEKEQGK
jgi:hypothetical protein